MNTLWETLFVTIKIGSKPLVWTKSCLPEFILMCSQRTLYTAGKVCICCGMILWGILRETTKTTLPIDTLEIVFKDVRHWWIQGAPPVPMGSNSFVFTCVFVKKCPCRRSAAPPPNGSAPEQRKILDPPLLGDRMYMFE